MPNWLVTGGSGFLGRALLARLRGEPVNLVALGRQPIDGVRSVSADLLDLESSRRALFETLPDVVFHLAGRTPPADPEDFDAGNRVATTNLIRSLEAIGRRVRVVAVGSAAELGEVPTDDLPVGEEYPCRPVEPYGRSKLAATEVVLGASPPVESVVARLFNPIGSGLKANQALGRFAAILAEGDGPITMKVGNLGPRRDFIDVRDVADALIALATHARPGLYHVGTGRSWSVGEGLETLIRLSGREVTVVVEPGRPGGVVDSRADIGRICGETGWSPRIDFERSLADLWTEANTGRD